MSAKTFFIINAILNLVIHIADAQITFQKGYGSTGEGGHAIQRSMDGGYFSTGSSNEFGHGLLDACLLKTDSAGNLTWIKFFGDSLNDWGTYVIQTPDSGFMITGSSESFDFGNELYLIRTDVNGNVIWSKTFGGTKDEVAWCIQPTNDGNYVICGGTSSFNNGATSDALLLKVDSLGNIIWSKRYGDIDDDKASFVQQTTDSGYIFCGTYGGGAIMIVKTDSIGDVVWKKKYGIQFQTSWATSVRQLTDNSYLIAAHISQNSGDICVFKIDSAGNFIWSKSYGSTGSDFIEFIEKTSGEDFLMSGWTDYSGNSDALLIKIDGAGDTLWTKVYGDGNNNFSFSVANTPDLGFIIGGANVNFETYHFIKTDSLGNSGCDESHATVTVASIAVQSFSTSNNHMFDFLPIERTVTTLVDSGATSIDYCFTDGMSEVIKNELVTIFPNPIRNSFSVHMNKKIDNPLIEIFRVNGEKVFSCTCLSERKNIPFDASPGVYILKVRNGEENYFQKLIVQ